MTPSPALVPPVRLPRAIADAIVAHALAERPNEACGIVMGSAPAALGGSPSTYVPCRNLAASPFRFEIHPDDLYRLHVEAEASDATGVGAGAFWAIVHSHVRSEARPSSMDVASSPHPDALHLLVSLAGEVPELRGWWIRGGAAEEQTLEIEAGA